MTPYLKSFRRSRRSLFAAAGVSAFLAVSGYFAGTHQVPVGAPSVALAEQSSTVSAPANVQDMSRIFVNIAKQTRPALVYIEVRARATQANLPEGIPPQFFQQFGIPQQQQEQRGAGSGFLTDLGNGYVTTNAHVVKNATEIKVTTFDNRKFSAKVLGSDPSVDIAVLKIQNFTPGALKQVNFGNSDSMEVGDWVVALGAPFGLPQTLTHGVVSALGRGDIVGNQALEDFIQTDAPINPGNSGGPLLNLKGEVIGINTAISSPSGSSAGIGFAVPSHMAQLAGDMLIKDGKITRGYLGFQGQDLRDLSPDVLGQLKVTEETAGALVAGVLPNSPADKGGLKSYDMITALDGKPVSSFTQLRTKIAFTKPGTEVALSVRRGGRPVELKLTVGRAANQT